MKLQNKILLFSALFLILHIIPFFVSNSDVLYGVDHYEFISASWLLLIALGVIIFIPKVNEKLYYWLKDFQLPKVNKELGFILISVVFMLIFWKFRSFMWYGDGGDLVAGFHTSNILVTAALTWQINHLLYALFPISELMAIQLTHIFAGGVFVYFLLKIVDELLLSVNKKIGMFLLVMSSGFTALFYGHIEVSGAVAAGYAGFIYYSIKYLNKKSSIVWPLVWCAIATALHFQAFALGACVVYIIWEKNKSNKKMLKDFVLAGIVFVVLMSLYAAQVYYVEWDASPPTMSTDKYGRFGSQGGIEGRFYPLFEIKHPEEQRFTMFERGHLIEVINQNLLLGFPGILLFILLFKFDIKNRKPVELFLTIMSFTYLLWSFVGTNAFHGRKDWDLFGSVTIPAAILGAYWLMKTKIENKTLFYVTAVLIVIALIHLIPWLYINHSANADFFVVLKGVL